MSTYDDASLIYYPSGYKASKAYSLKPTDGTGDLTFTRASTATRVNADGLIESVATGVPRIDFTSGCGKLLLEPQRANLVFPSATGSTQTVTTTAQSYTLSFYGAGTVVRSGTSTGTLVGTGANDRVFVTFTATAGSLILTVTGSVTNWQLEAGSYPTSYIPTTTTAVTRVADSASKTAISSLIGQTEGVLYADISRIGLPLSANQTLISINDGTSNNRIRMLTTLTDDIRFLFQLNGNNVQYDATTGSGEISDINQRLKIAIAYKSGDIAIYINGVLFNASSNTLTFSAPLSVYDIFEATSGLNIQSSILYTTRITNAELATLTTL